MIVSHVPFYHSERQSQDLQHQLLSNWWNYFNVLTTLVAVLMNTSWIIGQDPETVNFIQFPLELSASGLSSNLPEYSHLDLYMLSLNTLKKLSFAIFFECRDWEFKFESKWGSFANKPSSSLVASILFSVLLLCSFTMRWRGTHGANKGCVYPRGIFKFTSLSYFPLRTQVYVRLSHFSLNVFLLLCHTFSLSVLHSS